MIIDDDVQLQALLEYNLNSAGYRTTVFGNGYDAIGAFPYVHCDLIITDIMMPVMNGFEFVDTLHKRYPDAHVPIVFITARAEEKMFNKARTRGIIYYITKPFIPSQLISLIQKVFHDLNQYSKDIAS